VRRPRPDLLTVGAMRRAGRIPCQTVEAPMQERNLQTARNQAMTY